MFFVLLSINNLSWVVSTNSTTSIKVPSPAQALVFVMQGSANNYSQFHASSSCLHSAGITQHHHVRQQQQQQLAFKTFKVVVARCKLIAVIKCLKPNNTNRWNKTESLFYFLSFPNCHLHSASLLFRQGHATNLHYLHKHYALTGQ